MNNKKSIRPSSKTYLEILAGALILAGLIWSSHYNYLLFHTLAEGFSIAVAGAIFIIAWNTWDFSENGYLQFLGIAWLFIAGLDAVHTLAYKGMGIFPDYDANLPTQLWVAARYVESLSFLIAPAFLMRKPRRYGTFGIYLGVSVVLLVLVFTRLFPVCYVEGEGLTQFKIVSEYVISLLLFVTIGRLFQRRVDFSPKVFPWLVATLVLTILSELAFTFYVSVYGLSNLVGHILKILAFYCIYHAIIRAGLRQPYALLFQESQYHNEQLWREIAEREKAEEALLRSEEALQAILNNTQQSFILIEPSYAIRAFNQVAARQGRAVFGQTMQCGQSIFDFVWPVDEESFTEHFQQALRGEIVTVEKVFSGETWFSFTYNPIHAETGEVVGICFNSVDITARKRAEEALRQSEENFRLFFNHVDEAIALENANGSIIYISPAYEKIFGQPVEALLRDPAAFLEVIHPDDRERIAAIFARETNPDTAGQGYRTEYRIVRSDGEERWIASKGFPILDQEGNVNRIAIIAQDITALKRAQQDLERVRYSIDRVLDSVLWVGEDGYFLDVNAAACRNLGYTREELLTMGVPDIDPNFPHEVWPGHWEDMIQQGTMVIESIHEHKSGRQFPVEVAIHNQQFGDTRYNCVLVRDITERRQAEAAYRALVDYSLQGLCIIQEDRVVFANAALADMFGYTVEELLAFSPQQASACLTQEGQDFIRRQRQARQRGDSIVNRYEIQVYTKEGELRWTEQFVMPIMYRGASALQIAIVDITERKQAEEALVEHARALRRYVERLQILHEIDVAVLHAQSSDEIARAALAHLYDLIPCQILSIAEVDMTQQRARDLIVLVDGQTAESTAWFPLANAGEFIPALEAGNVHVAQDLTEVVSPSFLEQLLLDHGARAFISLPMQFQEELVGTLNLGTTRADFFQPDHIEVLREIATSLSVALRQARLLEQTRQDAKTKTLLLHEVNHRVKNNLDAIIGLLYLERRHAPPEVLPIYQPMMDNLIQRVMSLATVHKMLSVVEWAPLQLSELAGGLIRNTVEAAASTKHVAVDVTPSPVRVTPKQAHNLALVLSELTTNTLKYAFDERETVHVTVGIRQDDEKVTLTYHNDGPDYPHDVVRLERHSVGLDIVQRIVRQNLRGELALRNDGGPVTEIVFEV